MDEGDGEDVAAVSRLEDILPQGKDSLESCSIVEPQERVIVREGNQPRSSIQQFVDLLDGKDPINAVNTVGSSANPCSSYDEGRVQELTLGDYNVCHNTMNEGEMVETILSEWQHVNQPGDCVGPGSSYLHATNKEKCLTAASRALDDLRSLDALAGQPSNLNASVDPGQSTYTESGAVLQNVFPPGCMRMKIISKSSGSVCPEYFVKSTLKGKGVVYRGPISTNSEHGDQNAVKAAAARTAVSDPVVNVTEKVAIPSSDDTIGFDLGLNQKSHKRGVSLREWINSGQRKLHKVDSLLIFRQILDLVYSFHSEGKVLVELRPSCFIMLPCRKVKYCGHLQMEMNWSIKKKDVQKSQASKRTLELGKLPYSNFGAKHPRFTDSDNFLKMKSQCQLGSGRKHITNYIDSNITSPGPYGSEMECYSNSDSNAQGHSSSFLLSTSAQQHAFSAVNLLEEKWYRSPEEADGWACNCLSNIYCLGVFLFELLSSFNSRKVHAAAMSDLRHRILPPNFLSENLKEAGFCLWLLHPEPSLRPTARDILQSKVMSGFEALYADDESSLPIKQDDGESELLLHFLMSMNEQKQKHASKLVQDLGCIQADIKELEERRMRKSTDLTCSQEQCKYAAERGFLLGGDELSNPVSGERDTRFLKNVAQLENAYFSMRSQIQAGGSGSLIRSDRDVLRNRESWYSDQTDEGRQKQHDSLGDFYDGLCKYARYTKLDVCGTIRNRDITNSTNVICSLSFDRDEDYFATAGVSKKIKIFEFQALCDNSVDIHYPTVEMFNRSKISSVCWNSYIRNYLASTDYDGVVKLWDVSTGQWFSQYTEHERRAWSVDFSQLDPTKLASGSDDCSVKLWNTNERNCLQTIRNIANVCCVQFSAHSSHLLVFGSADYKIYCYDLRNGNTPWCILAGHEKAVSHVKFLDSETLVSASTDNTLKIWDLKRSSSVGLSSNACRLTLSGHTNEKNFVGLSVAEGYIACGSETNEVFTYHKSLPMPITSHKFGSIDPISGRETDDGNGQFVSSVCWKGKSNQLVAANSNGCIKVLQIV